MVRAYTIWLFLFSALIIFSLQAGDSQVSDSKISIQVTDLDKTYQIKISAAATLAHLKAAIERAFSIQQGYVHKLTLESEDGKHYEEYGQRSMLSDLGIKDGMKLKMKERQVIPMTATDQYGRKDCYYFTCVYADGKKKVSDFVQRVKNDTGIDIKGTAGDANDITLADAFKYHGGKELSGISVVTSLPRDASSTSPASSTTDSLNQFNSNLESDHYSSSLEDNDKSMLTFIAGAFIVLSVVGYSGYRVAKTDWFARLWYDQWGLYKKLTRQRQARVMKKFAEVYAWRDEQVDEMRSAKERTSIEREFVLRKERILRPFSPEDRKKLEALFEGQYVVRVDQDMFLNVVSEKEPTHIF